ncbi:MAG: hypothetical protein GC185_07120 [Alphaproteobacteria bacterium]|nr:hypothetical protein [Alphaproteobacteria bacterium]
MTAFGHDFPPPLPGEEKEHAQRLFRLAEANAKGENCKQDVQRAFDAYQAAAKAGHPPAMAAMGDICRTGEIAQAAVTPIDLKLAVRWYGRAVKEGFHDALFGMGRAFQDEKDHASAIACFEKSAYLHGKRESLREYGMCVFHGNGTPADPARGREIIKQAAMMDAEFSALGRDYLAANYGVELEAPQDDAERARRQKMLEDFKAECAARRAARENGGN